MPDRPRPVRSRRRARETQPPSRSSPGGKTQELSRLLVEKVIAGRTDEHWLEFLQIIQASELSSLSNTLDNDFVTFIKQVLD